MITQLCFPQFRAHVSARLGARLHFLPRENSADCYCSNKAELVVAAAGCQGPEPRYASSPPPELSCPVCRAASLTYLFTCLLSSFLLFSYYFFFSFFFFARLRTSFIYEYVDFREGTLTLKWTCKEPIEKQVPAALIMRTDKAFLLGLLMTFCLC